MAILLKAFDSATGQNASVKVDGTTVEIGSSILGVKSGVYAAAGHNHDATYLGLHAKADSAADSDKLNGQSASFYAVSTHNHDSAYLGISAKAADSDKLNGESASFYAVATHNHDATYLGLHAKADSAADSDKLNGQSASYYAISTHNHDSAYLGISATAADSSKLNGQSANYYATQTDLETVAAQGKIWKEALLSVSQLKNGASGGIYGANLLALTANLETDDAIILNDGSTTETYVAGTDFSVGGSISATLANLAAVVNGGAIAISATTGLLDSIDAVNDVLVIWQDTIGEPTRIYGNAAAAGRAKILPVAKCYDGKAADLVALPSSDPAATNFGFSRAKSSLVTNETHQCRIDDITYTWDNDSEIWNNSGSGSVPLASKTVYGKVQIGDGIAVSSGTISAAVDNSTIELSGTSPNKTLNVKSGVFAAAGHNHDSAYLGISAKAADSDKLNGESASFYAVATHNHDATYLGLHAKADSSADSDKLNGQSASYYAISTHNHDSTYLGISATAADSSKLNGQSASYYATQATADKKKDVDFTATNGQGSSITVGQLCYVKADGTVALAKANAAATARVSLMVKDASISNTNPGLFYVKGQVVGGFSDLDTTKDVFLSETTAGAFSQTPPALGNYFVKVGTPVSATEIYFDVEEYGFMPE